MSDFYSRQIQPLLQTLIKQFPAILITGPRQVGKSTLLQHISKEHQYITFDDPILLDQARNESTLFMLNHQGKLILDEVQYAPELFSSLKLAIDKQKINGLFLLSGSQAFQLMQNITETLAGRIAVLKLQGFSLREIQEVVFYSPFLLNMDYLNTNITNITDFTRFMIAIAARSGELLNYSNVAQEVGVSVDTIKRWTTILETSGIIYLLQPYHNNHLKRAIKTPKVYMMDTGLMAWLTKWLTPETIQQGAKSGQFFETFVVSEVIKSFYNNGIEPPIYFYRDTNQKEIDLLIEHNRTLYPIEIKTTASPNKKMTKAFGILKDNLPPDEIQIGNGVIINQYPQKLWLAEDLVALPVWWI